MAAGTTANLLDCGHVGEFGGVCQYRCGKRLCQACSQRQCARCGIVVCGRHSVVLDHGRRVFCPAHTRGYLAAKLITHLVRGDGRT